MWDEFVIGGEVQETSKKNVLKAISDQDMIQEVNTQYFFKFFHLIFNQKHKSSSSLLFFFILNLAKYRKRHHKAFLMIKG